MNYRRAASTAGASIVALWIMIAATFLCFIATFELSPFGSGLIREGELLWFTLLPASTAAGAFLIVKSAGYVSSWRAGLSTAVACALAILWVAFGPPSGLSSSIGDEELSVQFALLWTSASYAVIATVRRPEIHRRKKMGVYTLSAVAYVAGLLLVNADFGGLSLLASFAAWVLLPAAAASIRPRNQETPR